MDFCVLNLDGSEFMGEVPIPSQLLLLYQFIDGSSPLATSCSPFSPPVCHLPAVLPGPAVGNVPEPLHCHLKSEGISIFLGIAVRMGRDKESSYSPCCPVLMEGWLLCMIGWGLGESGWMKYSCGPSDFSTSVEIFWGRDKRWQKGVTLRKKCDQRSFLFYSVMTVIFSKQWNETKAG